MSFLSRIIDVHPAERTRVFGMFTLLGLIIATSYILKPVRSSLFLSQFGAERLPYVYMLVAVVLGVVAAAFARWVPRFNLPRLFTTASYLFAGGMVLFWMATRVEWRYTGFALYIWVSLFTAIMPSLFWLMANYVFFANEGRRLFPVVMAGGLLGSIAGGALTSTLVRLMGTSDLLLVGTLLLIVVAGLVQWNAKRDQERMVERRSDLKRQEKSRALKEDNPWKLIANSRYLSMMAMVMLLTSLISTLVDFQFNTVVEQSYETMDALTGFFGTFFAGINVVAFVLQLLVASRLVNRFGVMAGLLLLPGALALSSAAFLAVPTLLTASLIKTSDDGLSNSVNKSSLEILYLPISLAVKNRLKAWLDMFIERGSRGLGGATILLATSVLSFSVSQISIVVLALVVPWIALVVLLQREYVRTFRDSLSRRDITDLASHLRDPLSLTVFRQTLSGTDERELHYALALVEGTEDPRLLEAIEALTSHSSNSIRRAALRALRKADHPVAPDTLTSLVGSADPHVAAEAVVLLLALRPEEGLDALAAITNRNDFMGLDAVLDVLEDVDDERPDLGGPEFVADNYRSVEPLRRKVAARTIGLLANHADVEAQLSELLRDENIDVARAAARSAGRLRRTELSPLLVAQLTRRALRVEARTALARIGTGTELARSLMERLRDENEDPALRLALPGALAEFDDPQTANALLDFLPQPDTQLHYQTLKALGKMRSRYNARFSRSKVEALLELESRGWVELATHLNVLQASPSKEPSFGLLIQVMEERLRFARERIFRLLGLMYPQEELYGAWHRIVNGSRDVRAGALEYLSNVFHRKHKRVLYPLLDSQGWSELARRGAELVDRAPSDRTQTLRELARTSDAWLAACAVTAVGKLGIDGLRPDLEALRNHPHAFVREAAQSVLSQEAIECADARE